MPVSAPMHLSLPPMAPLAAGRAPVAQCLSCRPLIGVVHLRRIALVLATLALACLGAVMSDRSARPNGPLAWHAAPVVRGAAQ